MTANLLKSTVLVVPQVDTKLLEKLPTMSAHEMCLILWSFAKTGFNSPQGFEKAVPFLLARQDHSILSTNKDSVQVQYWQREDHTVLQMVCS